MFRSTFHFEVNSFERRLEIRVSASPAELNGSTRVNIQRCFESLRRLAFDSCALRSRVHRDFYRLIRSFYRAEEMRPPPLKRRDPA
jgi:hypothetical protein